MKRFVIMAVLGAALAACSHTSQTAQPGAQTTAASPAPAATNTLDFPVYDGSTVLVAQPWHQSVGGHMVGGTEVIAQTPATLAQLGDWIHGLAAKPPAGYTVAATGSGVEIAKRRAAAMGIDFEAFTHDVKGTKRALVVIAIDPKNFEAKAGPVLAMIGKYKMLPQSLRDPIDAQAKARTGYTVSEALDPATPLGAAIVAVDKLKDTGERGVLLLDGAKTP
ncbi:MAG: hypothetical protein KGN02_04330 [bacterium]|nr:hypothetical protein [bacterium]